MLKVQPFQQWCWNNWPTTCKNINLDTDLTSFRKVNSGYIIDLNGKWKTIKVLGYNLEDDFLDNTPKAWSMKEYAFPAITPFH